jgi:hypothetical protein
MNAPDFRAHAVLSASGSERWLNCTPSARVEDVLPETRSGYADEGTAAHDMVDAVILTCAPVDSLIGHGAWESNQYFTQELRDAAQICVNHGRDLIDAARARTKDAVILVEERLDFSALVPEGFGRGDFVAIADGVAWFRDWKFGRGKVVMADTPQLKLYGWAVVEAYRELYGIEKINLGIVQPRINHYDELEMTVEELLAWGESIRPVAKLAWDGAGEFRPGDWCGFCRAKATCRARSEANLAIAREEFMTIDPQHLSINEIAALLPRLDQIKTWANDLQDYALKQAAGGVTVPGFKLVSGRATRKYADQDQVAQRLLQSGYEEGQIYDRSLIGITAATKLLGKKKFSDLLGDLLTLSEPKPTLVSVDDDRPEISTSAQADFQ